jgi:SAM-dependent methyltransferase
MGLLTNLWRNVFAPQSQTTLKPAICWGTISQAKEFALQGDSTRHWAHAWIRRYMEPLPLSNLTVLDAGSGLSNPLLDWYRTQVRHCYLVEFLAEPSTIGNVTIVKADLEKGIPLPDESIDVITSASSIEHLSADGQVLFMREAERLLRPKGIVVMSVSYILGLNAYALSVLSRDPALINRGCGIFARLDLRQMLEAAPRLKCPAPVRWELFPGFDGFADQSLAANPDIIFDHVRSFGDVHCLPETDAMALRWAELGIYLTKRP